jgi:hypothetical protein
MQNRPHAHAGAELANVLNEAALEAVRRQGELVSKADIYNGMDRILQVLPHSLFLPVAVCGCLFLVLQLLRHPYQAARAVQGGHSACLGLPFVCDSSHVLQQDPGTFILRAGGFSQLK